MLIYKDLPDQIKKIAEKYNGRNEKIDVLPSKFHYNGEVYCVFFYSPSAEKLFVKENGEVPPFEEMKRPMLIVSVYTTSGSSIFRTGRKWAEGKTKRIYSSIEENLVSIQRKIQDKAPRPVLDDLENFLEACRKIVEEQAIIEKSFHHGVDLVDNANQTEYVSENEQKQLRGLVVEMTRAAVRQNQVQLDCEASRKSLLSYLESRLVSMPSIILNYYSIKRHEKNMLSRNSEQALDMGELREMVRADKPVEELDNADELIALIRNPKRGGER